MCRYMSLTLMLSQFGACFQVKLNGSQYFINSFYQIISRWPWMSSVNNAKLFHKFPTQWTIGQNGKCLFSFTYYFHSASILVNGKSYLTILLLMFTYWSQKCDCYSQKTWMAVFPPPLSRSEGSKWNSGEICRIETMIMVFNKLIWMAVKVQS